MPLFLDGSRHKCQKPKDFGFQKHLYNKHYGGPVVTKLEGEYNVYMNFSIRTEFPWLSLYIIPLLVNYMQQDGWH